MGRKCFLFWKGFFFWKKNCCLPLTDHLMAFPLMFHYRTVYGLNKPKCPLMSQLLDIAEGFAFLSAHLGFSTAFPQTWLCWLCCNTSGMSQGSRGSQSCLQGGDGRGRACPRALPAPLPLVTGRALSHWDPLGLQPGTPANSPWCGAGTALLLLVGLWEQGQGSGMGLGSGRGQGS